MIGAELTEIPTQADWDGKWITEITFWIIRTGRKLGLDQTAKKKGHQGKSNHRLFFVEAAKISMEEGRMEEWKKEERRNENY
jgi:hypothetical protein